MKGMRFLFRIYRSHPVLWLFLIIIVTPILFVINSMYSDLIATLPQEQGVRFVSGIEANIEIQRDDNGVPRIQAKSDTDAFYAMGYVHAQDRMWQLEYRRRMAQGKLAEIFGKGAMSMDVYMRTLGLYQNAESSVAALSKEGSASLNAYAAGINAWLAEAHPLPVEFGLLGIRPENWRPADSLAVVKLFALNLSGNYQQDLNRYISAQKFSRKQYEILFGLQDRPIDETLVDVTDNWQSQLSAVADLSADAARLWSVGGKYIGSNAWVVSGKYSHDGLATLANDPHLGLDMPSMWYAAELHGENIHVSGMSLVGLPIIMLGRNQEIAWGATNMLADTMDLYLEQVNADDNSLYRRGDSWLKFSSHLETIKIKADFPSFLREPLAPVEIRVRRTDKGPVLSDIIGGAEQPLSISWVGDSASDTSYDSFFRLNFAKDWVSFKNATKALISPTLNLLYIDNNQNIGYLGIGKIPLRGRGVGSMPVPAWDDSYAWKGFIVDSEMPEKYNPENGYIVSANNRMVADTYPHFISKDWAGPERAQQIEQLLQNGIASGKPLGILAHQKIQMDTYDRQAVEILPKLTSISIVNPELTKMLDYLRQWDGDATRESVAATIYYSWMRHLRTALLSDNLKGAWGNPRLQRRWQQIVLDMEPKTIVRVLEDKDFDWCDRLDTPEHETCLTVKREALEGAARELKRLLGSDIESWHWGNAHHAIFPHRPFSDVKGLDFLFERRVSSSGSPNSINLSNFNYSPKNGYVQLVGAGFRQIITLGRKSSEGQHWMMNSTGQSGNVVSEHYDDMLEKFSMGNYQAWPSTWPIQGRKLTLAPLNTER